METNGVEPTKPQVVSHYFHSEQLGEFFGALAKAQKSYKPVVKGNSNPFFKSKYADLGTVIDAITDALSANGLSVVQFPGVNGTAVELTTILGHSSGQYMGCTLKMPVSKADAQGVGSAITYARRYALQALVGVAAEEDDDGNAAVAQAPQKSVKTDKTQVQQYDKNMQITENQRKRLFAVAKECGWNEAELRDLLGKYGFEHSPEVTLSAYDKIIADLEARAAVKA